MIERKNKQELPMDEKKARKRAAAFKQRLFAQGLKDLNVVVQTAGGPAWTYYALKPGLFKLYEYMPRGKRTYQIEWFGSESFPLKHGWVPAPSCSPRKAIQLLGNALTHAADTLKRQQKDLQDIQLSVGTDIGAHLALVEAGFEPTQVETTAVDYDRSTDQALERVWFDPTPVHLKYNASVTLRPVDDPDSPRAYRDGFDTVQDAIGWVTERKAELLKIESFRTARTEFEERCEEHALLSGVSGDRMYLSNKFPGEVLLLAYVRSGVWSPVWMDVTVIED
jgi:hypothetical protein